MKLGEEYRKNKTLENFINSLIEKIDELEERIEKLEKGHERNI